MKPKLVGEWPAWDDVNAHVGGGTEWCPDLPGGPGLIYYPGGGGYEVGIAQPSSDLLTWTFRKQTLTGDAPPIQYSPANCVHISRFAYVPTIRAFLWFASTKAPAQVWRLF